MFDVFISHSSEDKVSFVNPLVEELKSKKLSVWYDNDIINFGDAINEGILDGIKQSLLYVIVLTPAFFQSNWTSFELAIKLADNKNITIFPILHNITIALIAEKYPFLLSYKYTFSNNNYIEVAEKIITTVKQIREERGYHNIFQTNLNELAKKLHSYNNIKLDKIAIIMRSISKELIRDPLMALNNANLILELILVDIATLENIYFDTPQNIFEAITKNEILNRNLIEHMKFIFQQRTKLISISGSLKNVDTCDVYLIEISLYSIIEHYSVTYFKPPIMKRTNLIVVPPYEITFEDMQETYNIETLSLPKNLIASSHMTKIWYEHNQLTLLGVRDTDSGKLIGFLHTLPITENFFERIYNGDFDDTTIPISEIKQYNLPGPYKLYISSLCIHPKYNSTVAFKLIYNSFIDLLMTLAVEHEIFITDIIADGATAKGATLCETIGMKKCATSVHNTNVYYASLIPPGFTTLKLRNKIGQKLINYYCRIYDEYKELF